MGRAKLKMKRIEDTTSRQITFSKRRNGILKKAYEISTLCDIDTALLMFSPAGRLTHFSTQKRIEDVLARFIDLSDRERENALAPQCLDQEHFFGILQDREHVIRSLNQHRMLNETPKMPSRSRLVANCSQIEELWHEIGKLQQQLKVTEEHLRMFEPDPESMTSMEELESCEKHLEHLLNRVLDRKEHLESKLVPSYQTNNLQETFISPSQESSSSLRSIVANWLPVPDGSYSGHALNSPIFTVDTRRDDISRAGVSSQECSCNLNLENMNDCRANLLAWPHLHDTADFRTSNEPSIPLQSNNEAKYPGSNNEPKYPAAMPFDEGDIQTGKLATTLGNVAIDFPG